MPNFVKVAQVTEIPAGTARCVHVKGKKIALFHIEGGFYAIDDTCSHAEASLSEGTIEGACVLCPLHGARFDIKTGRALSLPAWAPVETYEVRVEGDDILVSVE